MSANAVVRANQPFAALSSLDWPERQLCAGFDLCKHSRLAGSITFFAAPPSTGADIPRPAETREVALTLDLRRCGSLGAANPHLASAAK